jgi:triacylglycerol lipase
MPILIGSLVALMLLTLAVVGYVILTYILSGAVSTLRTFIHELALTLYVFAIHPLGWGRPYKPKQPIIKPGFSKPPPTPVLLVHGCCSNQSSWLWVRRELAQRGVGPVYTLNLSPAFASIEHFAEQLRKRVDELAPQLDGPLTLIAHSMGGLVSAYYAEQLVDNSQVAKIITLASPLQGTRLAPLGHGICCQQMTPGSPLIVDMRHAIAQPKQVTYYHMASKGDNIVAPYWAALPYLETPRQRVFDEEGHLVLLFSTPVIDQLVDWIRE